MPAALLAGKNRTGGCVGNITCRQLYLRGRTEQEAAWTHSWSGGFRKWIVSLLNDSVNLTTCCRVWSVLSRKFERVGKQAVSVIGSTGEAQESHDGRSRTAGVPIDMQNACLPNASHKMLQLVSA